MRCRSSRRPRPAGVALFASPALAQPARGMAVRAGVPAAALRKAFMDTMRDAAFLAATQKRKVDIDARNWQHTHMLVDKIVGASPDLVDRVKKLDRTGLTTRP